MVQPGVEATGCGHAFGDRVYYFFAAVYAVAGCEIFWVAGLIFFAHGDGAIFS